MAMFSENKRAKVVMSLQHSWWNNHRHFWSICRYWCLTAMFGVKRKRKKKKALQDEYKNFSSTTDMGMLVCKSPPYKWKICL